MDVKHLAVTITIEVMEPTVTFGNAAEDGAAFNGWFIGDLLTWARARGASDEVLAAAGRRVSRLVEVKWGIHPARMPRPGGWVASSGETTLSVLISGEFEVRFRPIGGGAETIVSLRALGDYVLSGVDSEHTWRAIADSVILSVRWDER
ncbi:MAG TPA: hypothetical protein VGP25_18225 [Gemmatimonadaceae bacterium]|nr:hypothetical protein [Gemmatimonadaceae bacterium]